MWQQMNHSWGDKTARGLGLLFEPCDSPKRRPPARLTPTPPLGTPKLLFNRM